MQILHLQKKILEKIAFLNISTYLLKDYCRINM